MPDEGVMADLETTRIMAIITEKKQIFIFDRKYSIAKNELRFLIGRAELCKGSRPLNSASADLQRYNSTMS